MVDSERGKREALARSREARVEPTEDWRSSGLCEEAQADGVPCSEPDCTCEDCEHARREAVPPPPTV